MSKKNSRRFILVVRKTRLQGLIERFNTWPQAKFYLEHNNVDAQDYLLEHDLYQQRLLEAEKTLKALGRFQMLERSYLSSYQFGTDDIVVVIGQDGLVANTLKYLDSQPVIAVNPDPGRWDGKLLPFEIGDLERVILKTIQEKSVINSVTFAEAKTNDGQRMLAVNDLFVGPKSHVSARYLLKWREQEERQSSSGIIVSTGMGSSGWFQSILAGALGVTGRKNHHLMKGFSWEEKRLHFAVREPFPSHNTGVDLVFGEITSEQPLILESLMPENGVIFSDGIEQDFIEFNSGSTLQVNIAKEQGALVSS